MSENLKLVTHPSAEACLLAFLRSSLAAAGETDLDDANLREWRAGCETLEDGADAGEITFEEHLEGLAALGLWGWIDENSGTVHAWIGETATDEDVIHLFAHEVAHCRMPKPNVLSEEERQCEAAAEVAVEAYRLLVNDAPPQPMLPPITDERMADFEARALFAVSSGNATDLPAIMRDVVSDAFLAAAVAVETLAERPYDNEPEFSCLMRVGDMLRESAARVKRARSEDR